MNQGLDTINTNPDVQAFLAQAHIARLATCNPDTHQPHVVPVWYEWDDGCIWISSFRSTRKIAEMTKNPLVSLVVDSDCRGEPARAVLIEGKAQLIEQPEFCIEKGFSIYKRYLGEEGARGQEPQSWLHDPDHLLVRLIPQKVYVWGI